MSLKQKKDNKVRQDFLLTFFEQDIYQEKEVNGFWLIKQWNSDAQKWQVAIYTKESFSNYKKYSENYNKKQNERQTPII